ncbi:MAG: serine/threonine-protein kinase [Thermoleophilia bacterium]
MPVAAQNTTPLRLDWRDRYELIRQIGSGGFSEVFEAEDRESAQRVALKVVQETHAMKGRVLREVQAAATLEHPNIVALYDWFGDGEHSYLVCELVEGEALAHLSRPLSDSGVVAVGAELLEALAYAHSQGVVHRDIKPQNVMLDRDGRTKVMDFGIALLLDAETLTQDGDVIGTVAYMSPEQANGRRVGPSTDVYSAGVVLYELLAGRHPLRGDTPAQTMANVAAGRLPSLATLRPDLPRNVVELIDAACAVRPASRPSAAALAESLRTVLDDGVLHGRRWRRLQSFASPLLRGGAALERVGGAVLAVVVCAVVLRALPAYPTSWDLPLIALSAGLWAVMPRAGLAWLLGILAFPVFNVSLSVGVVYLVGALVAFFLARSRPVVVLWPALALALAPAYLVLLAPAGAPILGRIRGPLTAAWAGAGVFLYLALAGQTGPFTMYQSYPAVGSALAGADNPLAVVTALAGVVLTPACVLQAAVWACLAVLLGFAFACVRTEVRLWVWALSFAGVYLVYSLVPGAAWGDALSLTPLALNVAAAASVILLPLAVVAGNRPEELDDGYLQGYREEA